MSEPPGVRVEDLEVSVRSMELLLDLGVETLGDLLALPSISTTKIVVAELTEVLSEHGLVYAGKWDIPETPPVREAIGSVTERWQTIEEWMEERAPDVLESLRPPASAEAIVEAEKQLGVALPAEYKELLARHDGQEDMGPMVGFCSLIPTADLVEKRDWLAGLLSESGFDAEQTDDGIATVVWNPGWVPIGHFQRDYMILDTAPASGGKVGQIFVCYVDDDRRSLVATSCADLLSRFFRELQDGTIDLS